MSSFVIILFNAQQNHKIYELFQARYKLYKNIYFHRASLAIEHMFCDVLLHADAKYNFLEAIQDPSLYVGLSDYIFQEIKKDKVLRLTISRLVITFAIILLRTLQELMQY